MDNIHIANRVSIISIILNTLLSVFKLTAGIVANSGAMISDAVHSISDVLSTFAVILGVNISAKKSDKGHPYGHERIESIFSIILAIILFSTGIAIGYNGLLKILSSSTPQTPKSLALVAAVVSICAKEWMFHYTRCAAKKINSTALMADAWHHRSDSLSSIGSFIGIFGARLGFPILDPIASIVICLFIIKASWDIFYNSVNQLIDHSCNDTIVSQIRNKIIMQNGVICIDDLKTRQFGAKIYIDVEIGADGNLLLYQSHSIAQNVHDAIESDFPNVKHCMVHVNPKNIS